MWFCFQSINTDIHNLKNDCLEAFEMTEECKNMHDRNNHPQYRRLLKSRALDPASGKKMKEIRTHYQYVLGSLREVNEKLDSEWDMQKDKRKAK